MGEGTLTLETPLNSDCTLNHLGRVKKIISGYQSHRSWFNWSSGDPEHCGGGVYFVCVFCSVLKFLRQFYLVNNIENQWSRLVATCLIFVLVNQSCPTLRDSIDYSPPGSFVHGILQARILEWVAISFSRGSSWPRDCTQLSFIAGRFFTVWATHTH